MPPHESKCADKHFSTQIAAFMKLKRFFAATNTRDSLNCVFH